VEVKRTCSPKKEIFRLQQLFNIGNWKISKC
jgi:hypothetical protein